MIHTLSRDITLRRGATAFTFAKHRPMRWHRRTDVEIRFGYR